MNNLLYLNNKVIFEILEIKGYHTEDRYTKTQKIVIGHEIKKNYDIENKLFGRIVD